MINSFDKSFEDLLEEILTDWRNQDPGVDLSQLSPNFIKSACYASALWGLYKYQGYIARQIFPDTADEANLERHSWVRGLERKSGESAADLLARYLDWVRRPPAGGNRYDYVKWALEVQGVEAAICIPTGQGPGTVDVVIMSDPETTGSETPNQELLEAVYAHIIDLHPAASLLTRILAPVIVIQDITLTLNVPGANPFTVAQEISAYVNSLALGQSLYISQLVSLALAGNYGDVTVTLPAANIIASTYQLIRPGVVSVT